MKNYKKGFVVPLIIVIAVLVIGGGVYYFSKSKQSTNSSIVTEVANTAITPSIPSGFMVYTGKLFGAVAPIGWLTETETPSNAISACTDGVNMVSNPVSKQTVINAGKNYFHYLGSNSSVISIRGGIDETRMVVNKARDAMISFGSSEQLLKLTFYDQQMTVDSMKTYPSGIIVYKDEYTLPQKDRKGVHMGIILNDKNATDLAHTFVVDYIAPTKDFSETLLQTVVQSLRDNVSKNTCPNVF